MALTLLSTAERSYKTLDQTDSKYGHRSFQSYGILGKRSCPGLRITAEHIQSYFSVPRLLQRANKPLSIDRAPKIWMRRWNLTSCIFAVTG